MRWDTNKDPLTSDNNFKSFLNGLSGCHSHINLISKGICKCNIDRSLSASFTSFLSSSVFPLQPDFFSGSAGRHAIWRPAHWVPVPDRCGDAGCRSDEAAGLPGQNGPAAGCSFSAGVDHWGHYRWQCQERREYCQWGGEWSPCLSKWAKWFVWFLGLGYSFNRDLYLCY